METMFLLLCPYSLYSHLYQFDRIFMVSVPLTAISPLDIEKFMNGRLGARMAPKTVMVDVKTLSTAFKREEAYGVIPKNPVNAVRRPKEECSEREVLRKRK